LLFAYREVPKTTTGFSPFKLLYGRTIRGPMNVLKEAWVWGSKVKESIASYVLNIRDNMETMQKAANLNLAQSQHKQKRWYDKNARIRKFNIGDKVLIMLPTSENKLLAKWKGPYKIIEQVGEVNYKIATSDSPKKTRIMHVNMLRKICEGKETSEALWANYKAVELGAPDTTRLVTVQMPHNLDADAKICENYDKLEVAGEENEERYDENEDIPSWKDSRQAEEILMSTQLTVEQKYELKQLLKSYADVLCGKPGKTKLTERKVYAGEAGPIRVHPYRVPHQYCEQVKIEIAEMLEQGIIEPSASDWAFPIVVV